MDEIKDTSDHHQIAPNDLFDLYILLDGLWVDFSNRNSCFANFRHN